MNIQSHDQQWTVKLAHARKALVEIMDCFDEVTNLCRYSNGHLHLEVCGDWVGCGCCAPFHLLMEFIYCELSPYWNFMTSIAKDVAVFTVLQPHVDEYCTVPHIECGMNDLHQLINSHQAKNNHRDIALVGNQGKCTIFRQLSSYDQVCGTSIAVEVGVWVHALWPVVFLQGAFSPEFPDSQPYDQWDLAWTLITTYPHVGMAAWPKSWMASSSKNLNCDFVRTDLFSSIFL